MNFGLKYFLIFQGKQMRKFVVEIDFASSLR